MTSSGTSLGRWLIVPKKYLERVGDDRLQGAPVWLGLQVHQPHARVELVMEVFEGVLAQYSS